MMNTDSDEHSTLPPNDHPSTGMMAAYIDGVATDEEQRQVEIHLASCAHCRDELVVVQEATRSKSSRVGWMAGVAAAAALVALLLLTPTMIRDGSDPVWRGTDSVPAADASDPGGPPSRGEDAIEIVTPSYEMEPAEPGELRFVWRSAGPDAQYRFTITTAAGDPVATITTADTSITELEGAELAPDTEYYWWVDALRADRATVESGLQRFRTAP